MNNPHPPSASRSPQPSLHDGPQAPLPSVSPGPSGGAIVGLGVSMLAALFMLLNAVMLYLKHSEGDAGSESYPVVVVVLVVLALLSVSMGVKGMVGKRR